VISPQEEKLLGFLDREELVRLTRELVRIDSVIRPETGNTERRVVEYLRAWIRRELGLEPLLEEVEAGRQNLSLTLDSGRPGPCLLLEGHTDVVSEGDHSRWSVDPFGGELKDGRIYGRGACDMKAGLAVNLVVAKALQRAGFSGRLSLALVCDEENMMIGIKDFIRRGHADDVDAALVSEPEGNQLCLSMKGALRAVVRVHGRMAHGAMPRMGINPNTRLARVILAFEEYERREIERCGEDEFLGYPSVTFTVIQSPPAGEPAQLNVMPGQAMAYLDIRTTLCQDHATVRRELQGIIEELARGDPDFKAQIEFFEDRPVVSIEREEPIVVTAAQAYRDVTGREPRYNGVPGATDGTFLRAWKGVPCLVNGPGPRHLPHQVDEYVEVEELWEAARVYALTASRYLSTPGGEGKPA
jgi:succinyl-diaminopimelate desuccinylase